MGKESILLAYSGGIDSHHAAQKLTEQGFVVTLLMLDMLGDKEAIREASVRASEIGAELVVEDVRELFEEKIIKYFIEEYMGGRTPAPCTLCNGEIKWKILYQKAEELGIDRIATGHYFGVEQVGEYYYVVQSEDKIKDQSYYLWALSQEILKRAVTPMRGVIKKRLIDELADQNSPKESMGICFLKGQPYGEFLMERCGRVAIKEGEIVDNKGITVGAHNGYPLYTIGQKRGVNTSCGGRVVGIDAATNRLTVGSDEQLYSRNLILSGYIAPNVEEVIDSDKVWVKIRGVGRNPQGYCKVTVKDSCLHIALEQPAWAAAKGQPTVLYIDNRVVCGGILEEFY